MGKFRVQNLREGDREGNWIRYWRSATGMPTIFCHKVDCTCIATDGAHIQLVNNEDHHWYIVPLCHKCNCQFGEEMEVTGPLVSATTKDKILP